jgi:hypothetical protein
MRPLLVPLLLGWLAAQLFLGALLLLDVGGVGALIFHSEWPVLPAMMLSISLGGLVGAAMVATSPSLDDDATGPHKRPQPHPPGACPRARRDPWAHLVPSREKAHLTGTAVR